MKNFQILMRSNWLFLFVVLSPILSVFTLYYMQEVSHDWAANINQPNPKVYKMSKPSEVNTMKIGFTHGKTDWSDHVLNYISSQAPGMELKTFPELNQTTFIEKVAEGGDNKIGVLFCTEYIEVGNTTYPCVMPNSTKVSYIYDIIYNFTSPHKIMIGYNIQNDVLAIKALLDNAILNWASTQKNISQTAIDIEVQGFPVLDRHIGKFSILPSQGTSYLIFIPLIICALFLMEVVKEKSAFIKIYLNLNNVSQFEYWTSWLLIGFLLSLICAIDTPLVAMAFGFEEFYRIPYVLQVLLFFLINSCCLMTGAIFATFINSYKLAFISSLVIILAGFSVQVIFCNNAFIQLLSGLTIPLWVKIVRVLFLSYPPFNFAVIFYRLFDITGLHYDYNTNTWAEGRDFEWSDLFVVKSGKMYKSSTSFEIPAFIENFYYLGIFLAATFPVLWYLDHVVPNNRTHTW